MGKLLKMYELGVKIWNANRFTPIEKQLNALEKDICLYHYPYLYTIYQAVMVLKPKVIVDWGTSTGTVAITMAMAQKEIGEGGVMYSFDVFENDAKNKIANPISIDIARNNVSKYGFNHRIYVYHNNFWEWLDKEVELADLIYLDINNDGEKILKAFEFAKKHNIKNILFEGGSVERDNYKWMIEKNRVPINSIKDIVKYTVIDKRFPSLSIIKL